MTRDELIAEVRSRGGFDSDAQAQAMTEVVLATLGECLDLSECAKLASELPKGIKEYLGERKPERPPRKVVSISRAEFVNRVRARGDVNRTEATAGTAAVVATLKQAVSAGEMDNVRDRLPGDLSELFA